MLWPEVHLSTNTDLLSVALGAPALMVVLVHVALILMAWYDKRHKSSGE